MSKSSFVPEVQGQVKAFGLLLARSVREYFKDEENRKRFEKWHLEKHGEPYVWVPMDNTKKTDKP